MVRTPNVMGVLLAKAPMQGVGMGFRLKPFKKNTLLAHLSMPTTPIAHCSPQLGAKPHASLVEVGHLPPSHHLLTQGKGWGGGRSKGVLVRVGEWVVREGDEGVWVEMSHTPTHAPPSLPLPHSM